MKATFVNLKEYFYFLLSKADDAYWLNRRVTIMEIINWWSRVSESCFDKSDEKLIRIRSGYHSSLVVQSVREDKTFWVRLLMAFFTFRKRMNKTEREIYLAEANKAWNLYVKAYSSMFRFNASHKGQKIVC